MSKTALLIIAVFCLSSVLAWSPPNFKQCDSRWGSQILGHGPDTICKSGCLMTSVTSMVVGCGQKYDPSSMNAWLKSHGGFSGDLFVWGSVSSLGFTFRGKITGTPAIKAAYKAGQRVILNVNQGHHYVLATGDSGTGFNVMDPGSNKAHYTYGEVVSASIFSAGC